MSRFDINKYNNQAIGNANQSGGLFKSYRDSASPEVLAARGDIYNDSMTPWQDSATDWVSDSAGGLYDGFTAAGFNDVAQGLGGLYGMYQGHQMLGLYEDQVDDMKKNSALNRQEVARRNGVRDNWSTAFQGA